MPHVKVVSPVFGSFPPAAAVEVIDGIDLPSFEALGGPFQYVKGGPFQGPDDMLVDDYIARQKHVKVGDTMEVLNHHVSRGWDCGERTRSAQVSALADDAGFDWGEGQGLSLLPEAR